MADEDPTSERVATVPVVAALEPTSFPVAVRVLDVPVVQEALPTRTPIEARLPLALVVAALVPNSWRVATDPVVADEDPNSWRVPVSPVVQLELPATLQLRTPEADVVHDDAPTIAPLGVVTGNADIGVELMGPKAGTDHSLRNVSNLQVP